MVEVRYSVQQAVLGVSSAVGEERLVHARAVDRDREVLLRIRREPPGVLETVLVTRRLVRIPDPPDLVRLAHDGTTPKLRVTSPTAEV
jgi:hypothetical protein